jgi:hypothetical protein
MRAPQRFGFVLKSCAPFAALFVCFVLVGCERPGKVERSILREIHRSCMGASPCSIRVRDHTPFDWDRAFYFDYAVSESDCSKALGAREEGYSEFEGQFVFLKNGGIVYQESEPTNVEKQIRDGIAFADPDGQNFTSFTVNAAFTVSIEDGSDGKWFLLKQTP